MTLAPLFCSLVYIRLIRKQINTNMQTKFLEIVFVHLMSIYLYFPKNDFVKQLITTFRNILYFEKQK